MGGQRTRERGFKQVQVQLCLLKSDIALLAPLGLAGVDQQLLEIFFVALANIQLARLRQRLAERELNLELTDEALDKLVAVGFDPVYGARPLKRAIQRWIENPLAQRILAGDFAPGARVQAKVEGEEIVFA